MLNLMIKRKNLIFSIALNFLMVTGCKENGMIFKITEHKELTGIASASGIEATSQGLYIIGDNSPFLFKLNSQLEIEEKIKLFPENQKTDSLFEKMAKPDLEALTTADKNGHILYAFGSGSKSPERDILIEIDLRKGGEISEYSLKNFYEDLKAKAQLSSETLNIEAAAILGDDIFLFNRGKNLIVRYSLSDFKKYLEGTGKIPLFQIFNVQLPEINGISAGFSGASLNEANESIIFTATVEDTSNWIDDGEVLGSFLGVIPLKDLKDQLRPKYISIGTEGEQLPIKVESVTVLPPFSKTSANLILVTDSDGGISEFLRGTLTF